MQHFYSLAEKQEWLLILKEDLSINILCIVFDSAKVLPDGLVSRGKCLTHHSAFFLSII